MPRISNQLQFNRMLFRQTGTRQLANLTTTPQHKSILLQPQTFQPQARFIRKNREHFPKIIEVYGLALVESLSEGTIQWIKEEGDYVKKFEVIAKIKNNDNFFEVYAPYSGTIIEILVDDGSCVNATQKLYKLYTTGDTSLSKKLDIAFDGVQEFIAYEGRRHRFIEKPVDKNDRIFWFFFGNIPLIVCFSCGFLLWFTN